MSRDDWYYPPPPPRREAKDGVRARSRRGDIGSEWWSRRFVEALEAICEPRRLQRGRSYARTGQVADLDIGIGRVTASVQGSRRTPYDVVVEIDSFADHEWAAIESAMADQAIFLAALLAGIMPDDIESAFASAGMSLFPARPAELRMSCTCPDSANPCKHLAAALYILAETFDEDPFEIFRWRGRAKTELIERLRDRRSGAIEDAALVEDTEAATLPDVAPPLSASPAEFWTLGSPISANPLVPEAAEPPEAALIELGPLPPELERDRSQERLVELYRRATRGAERLAYESD